MLGMRSRFGADGATGSGLALPAANLMVAASNAGRALSGDCANAGAVQNTTNRKPKYLTRFRTQVSSADCSRRSGLVLLWGIRLVDRTSAAARRRSHRSTY